MNPVDGGLTNDSALPERVFCCRSLPSQHLHYLCLSHQCQYWVRTLVRVNTRIRNLLYPMCTVIIVVMLLPSPASNENFNRGTSAGTFFFLHIYNHTSVLIGFRTRQTLFSSHSDEKMMFQSSVRAQDSSCLLGTRRACWNWDESQHHPARENVSRFGAHRCRRLSRAPQRINDESLGTAVLAFIK